MANRAALIKNPPHEDRLRFHCPGCDTVHDITVNGQGTWGWDGKLDLPTVTPSILCHRGKGGQFVCHSFIEKGQIRFLGDCSHDQRNQTVDLPEITEQDLA